MKRAAVLTIVLCCAAIYLFSSQDYRRQNVKPFLHRTVSEQQLQQLLPDVRFQYDGRIIDAHGDPYRFVEFLLRKFAHLFLYGVLGMGLFFLFLSRRFTIPQAWAASMFIAAVIAILDEWNQSGRWNRHGSVYDVGLDLTGAGLSILLAIFVSKRVKRR